MEIHFNKNYNDIPCGVRIKFRNEIRTVFLPWENLSFDSFRDACKFFFFDKGFSKKWLQKKIILVINEFDVKVIDGSSKVLILTDNLGAPISVHKFVETIKTFHCGSSYYVDVQYESTVVSSPLAVVTPLVRYLFL